MTVPACAFVCSPVEAKPRDPETCPWYLRKPVEIGLQIKEQEIVETRGPLLTAARQKNVAIADEHAAQLDAAVRCQPEPAAHRASAGRDVDRSRIARNRRAGVGGSNGLGVRLGR